MSSIGLQIGLRSLLSAQTALDTIGHNVANVNTPGYSRQSLSLSAGRSLSIGNLQMGVGVNADSIRRSTDLLLTARIHSQTSVLGMLDSRLVKLSEVEALFGEPSDYGMSALFSSMFGKLSGLSANPSDSVLRGGVIEEAKNLSSRFNQLSKRLTTLNGDAFTQIRTTVDDVNRLAEKVAMLNVEVATIESTGAHANDLRDQRDVALQELAELVGIDHREDKQGRVQVLIGGRLLVGQKEAFDLEVMRDLEGEIRLTIDGNSDPIEVKGGRIGGLLQFGDEVEGKTLPELDTLARNLIYEFNRVHSTGVPPGGAFHRLDAEYALQDVDGDGDFMDERLRLAGLPFELEDGLLRINVLDESTGEISAHDVAIDAKHMTVGEFVDAIEAIPNLHAGVNEFGTLQIASDVGFGFDFSTRLDRTPSSAGTFGGGVAALGSNPGPFALSNGQTLDISGPSGIASVTFASSDFEDIGAATAAEIADVLNADASIAGAGMRAVVIDDRVMLQTLSEGSTTAFTVTGGTAAAAFGWTAGTTVNGHDTSLEVNITGEYIGESNDQLTFLPSGNGTVGTTPGLRVDVFNSKGVLVQSIEVGDGYQPGTDVELANGLRVSFGLGELSATDGDAMALDLVAEPDQAGVLAALGLNSFFVGTDASSIAVRDDLEVNPDLLAASADGSLGDNGILLELLSLEDRPVEGLGQNSIGEYYSGVVGDVAFKLESGRAAWEVESSLTESLQLRRDQLSGVNVDEELVNMIQFEQSFQASSRFLQVVNQLNDDLLSIL